MDLQEATTICVAIGKPSQHKSFLVVMLMFYALILVLWDCWFLKINMCINIWKTEILYCFCLSTRLY